jgi:iron complex transport system permease protein
MKSLIHLNRSWWLILFLFVLLLVAAIASTAFGAVKLSFYDAFAVWFGDASPQAQFIIEEMRIPRTFIALLVGGCLAMSGGIFQAITRNSLASPDLIGISAGAGLGAVILILLAPSSPPGLLPLFAFAGGLLTAVVIYLLAWQKDVESTRLILIGIAVSAVCLAARDVVVLKAPDELDSALFWLAGSVWGKGSEQLSGVWIWAVALLGLGLWTARPLNVLQLGNETAKGLGIHVEKTRLLITAIGVGLAGCAVSVARNIGFVGLIAPHMARLLVGSDMRKILPASAILGALLTVAADTVGRVLIAPSEIPAGIFTSLIGCPYFLWLLRLERR